MTITSVHFTDYKALSNYSISLHSVNILAGPNNSGKSTILSAFRVLEYALRIAKTKRPSRVMNSLAHGNNTLAVEVKMCQATVSGY